MAHLCDLETAQLLGTLTCRGSVRGCDMTDQVMYTGSLDGFVRVWDKRALREVVSLKTPATCHGVCRAANDQSLFVSTG